MAPLPVIGERSKDLSYKQLKQQTNGFMVQTGTAVSRTGPLCISGEAYLTSSERLLMAAQ